MHYRNNVNSSRFLAVEYPVGETSQQRPSDVSFKDRPGFWEYYHPFDGRIHFLHEIITKFHFNRIVVTDCLIKFCFCIWME